MRWGVASRAELLATGVTGKELKTALEVGQLTKVRRGWYASPLAPPNVIAAIRAGGRLGCLSGCSEYGLWTPHHRSPHIIIPPGATATPAATHRAAATLPSSPVYPLEECLTQVIRYHDPESALMVMESAVQQRAITRSSAEVILAGAGQKKRETLQFFDPNAASGSETRVRLFLQQRRFPVTTQAHIPGLGWVDLLVGRSLILECDSAAHHSDPAEDRRRDLVALSLGYRPIRLSYGQIHHTWPHTQETLLAILHTRKHLELPRPPRPR